MFHHETVFRYLTLLVLVALLMGNTLAVKPVSAASIVVNSALDNEIDDDACTLREAIYSANNNIAFRGCSAGSGADVITFADDYTITLSNTLFISASSEISIIGNGKAHTLIEASTCNPVTLEPLGCTPSSYGVFDNAGTLTLEGLTVRHGNISDGGGIFNNAYATLTVTESAITGNKANDGNGGGIYNGYLATLTMTDSIVSGNSAEYHGGGIYNGYLGSLILTGSTLSGNSAARNAGGLYNYGEASVTNSTLSGNTANEDGGAIFNGTYAIMTVTNSTLSGNHADDDGGGIANGYLAILTLTNSTLSGNSAAINGGGILNDYYGTTHVINSTLSGNTAFYGGGMFNLHIASIKASTLSGNTAVDSGGGILSSTDSTLDVINSTFSENTATASVGGGIDNSGVLTIFNSTLYGNDAGVQGGGIINSGTLNFSNTIIANSTHGDCVNGGTIHTDSRKNLVTDGSCDAYLDSDPKLGPLADNGGPTLTHALLPGSTALDAGNADVCSAIPVYNLDQRGISRPQDGDLNGVAVCDIGAFELEPDLVLLFLPLIVR